MNDFEHELTNRPLAIAGRQQMLAQPWQLDGSDRKLALQEQHKYENQKVSSCSGLRTYVTFGKQRSFSGLGVRV